MISYITGIVDSGEAIPPTPDEVDCMGLDAARVLN